MLKKSAVKAAVAAIFAVGAISQAAAAPGVFTINPLALPAGTTPPLATEHPFNADFISGNSSELVQFGAGGSFTSGGFVEFTGFKLGAPALSPAVTGLLIDYNLYLNFTLSGVVSSGPATCGTTTLSGCTWTLTSANFQVFADPNTDTTFTAAAAQPVPTPTAEGNTADDIFLGSGSLVTGTAGFDSLGGAFINLIDFFAVCRAPGISTVGGTVVPDPRCTSGIGGAFFASPNPFYNFAFAEFNNTTQGIQQNGPFVSINDASGGVDFNIAEPSSLALLGIGLLGFAGFARRRQS